MKNITSPDTKFDCPLELFEKSAGTTDMIEQNKNRQDENQSHHDPIIYISNCSKLYHAYMESFFTLLFLDKKKQLSEAVSRTPYKLSLVSKNQGLLPQRPATARYGTPERLA